MTIATFKGKVFQVSAQQVYTINGMTWTGAIDSEAQEKLGDKPSTWIKGLALDTMSFEITLRADFGHNVRAEIESWEEIRDSRSPDFFILGSKPLGKNKWLLKSTAVENQEINGRGEILKATLKLEFEEYVRAGKKPPEKSKTAGIEILNLIPAEIYDPPTKLEDRRDNPNFDAAYLEGWG